MLVRYLKNIFPPKMLLLDLNVMTYEIKLLIKDEKKEKCVTSDFFQFYDLTTLMRISKKI
jgi:hypothetical protein